MSQQIAPQADPERSGLRIPMWFALPVMAIVLILSGVILIRVWGPLSDLLFPAEVPVPDGVQEVEHAEAAADAEYWVYRTDRPASEIAAFYEAQGGVCEYQSPPRPGDLVEGQSYRAAVCISNPEDKDMRWEVLINEGYLPEEGPTVFRIYHYEGLD